ncbi:ABC transporter ATP-binding protein/permease [Clostridium sp. MSJ-8]|uniref:amino acid ABC transporter ATP-binding/permease protein n=1 Tax=Clostridium sp. MSJ-8 TaxID=2841510 RepID=UPI001C0F0960|nr:ABC transporter ATP-binding protein [Clostridium sp. MSJ-8]MBU5488278.1 ABC transporter ATP-binding protein/permease [Clostridium sp. MSJ-8]
MHNEKNRSGFKVMAGLIGMVKPLVPFMILAIIMGVIGNLVATFITILGGYGIVKTGDFKFIFIVLVLFAVFRGVFRYLEQMSNHYIAFKLLEIIRNKVFGVLRKLAPAKLEGKERGNLISIITTDIELLEVFYAHTISPICIAVIYSIVMIVFLGVNHWSFAVIAVIAYIIVGLIIPIINGRIGKNIGEEYRSGFGELNSYVLDNLRGIKEVLQYDQGKERLDNMNTKSDSIENKQSKLKSLENKQAVITNSVIMVTSMITLYVSYRLIEVGSINNLQGIISIIGIMSSFGPTAALASLSNNLHQTLASGNRVLNILEEKPMVEDIVGQEDMPVGDIKAYRIDFTYADSNKQVLDGFNATIKKGKINGILGASGSGKSTFLKLLMRFFKADSGEIRYIDKEKSVEVNNINTQSLRSNISYVTQETQVFSDTIEENIRIAKLDATTDEVIEAAKKASLHEFIMTLPHGYNTRLSELGESLSGGERQRIGIARAFLHDGDIMLLDEPTSNLDSLNEAVILKALETEKDKKTIVIVSHRKSTMAIAESIMEV